MDAPRFTITPSPDVTVTAPFTHGIRIYGPSGTLHAVAAPGQSVTLSTADMELGATWRVEPTAGGWAVDTHARTAVVVPVRRPGDFAVHVRIIDGLLAGWRFDGNRSWGHPNGGRVTMLAERDRARAIMGQIFDDVLIWPGAEPAADVAAELKIRMMFGANPGSEFRRMWAVE